MTMRVAVSMQIIAITSVMLPSLLGYLEHGTPGTFFKVEILTHHTLGLAVIALWIYINLVFAGMAKTGVKLATVMRFHSLYGYFHCSLDCIRRIDTGRIGMEVAVNNISTTDISTELVRIPISGDLSLQVGDGAGDYPSSRIQKGPVLIYRNKDLSEEGVGFGVPVLKFGHEAVFPGNKRVTLEKNNGTVVIKIDYDLNLVERMAMRGNKKIDSRAFYKIKEWFHGLHRDHPGFRGVLMPAFNAVSRICCIETRFDEVVSAGSVCVAYTINPEESTISISVDISGVKKNGCSEIIILNEQGATCFDRYCDSNGVSLTEGAIGTWDEISADEATFVDFRDGIEFTLKGIGGSRMLRGREFTESRLAWSGLAYVLPPHVVHFEYGIHVGSTRI